MKSWRDWNTSPLKSALPLLYVATDQVKPGGMSRGGIFVTLSISSLGRTTRARYGGRCLQAWADQPPL